VNTSSWLGQSTNEQGLKGSRGEALHWRFLIKIGPSVGEEVGSGVEGVAVGTAEGSSVGAGEGRGTGKDVGRGEMVGRRDGVNVGKEVGGRGSCKFLRYPFQESATRAKFPSSEIATARGELKWTLVPMPFEVPIDPTTPAMVETCPVEMITKRIT
jgi:hypothetical protein